MSDRPKKSAFAEMRDMGVHGLPIYCQDYKCCLSTAISADRGADDLRLSDIEHCFVCEVCGKRGADVRPDFNWNMRSLIWVNAEPEKTSLLFDGHSCQLVVR